MALFFLPKDRTRRDVGRQDAYCCVVIVPSWNNTVEKSQDVAKGTYFQMGLYLPQAPSVQNMSGQKLNIVHQIQPVGVVRYAVTFICSLSSLRNAHCLWQVVLLCLGEAVSLQGETLWSDRVNYFWINKWGLKSSWISFFLLPYCFQVVFCWGFISRCIFKMSSGQRRKEASGRTICDI